MKAKPWYLPQLPQNIGGFPRKNMRFKTLPKKPTFLNSKSNREGRSTHRGWNPQLIQSLYRIRSYK
jgi:hypothetical protein